MSEKIKKQNKIRESLQVFFQNYWDYAQEDYENKGSKIKARTFSGVCLAGGIPVAVSICGWWFFCSTAAFLLTGESGAVVESVFTADPESVLSSPDFELPYIYYTTEISQMLSSLSPKKQIFPQKRNIKFQETSKYTQRDKDKDKP